MAGAGSRTRKDGSPSARVGSIEVLRPKMLGPSMPTMREVRELGRAADAASPRSKAGRDLAARAQSARAARTAFMAARRVEGERERRIAGLRAELAKEKSKTDNAYWDATRLARGKPSAITAADAHRRQRELHDEILGLRGVPKDRTGAKLRKTSDDVEKITGAEARAHHVEAPKPAVGPRAQAKADKAAREAKAAEAHAAIGRLQAAMQARGEMQMGETSHKIMALASEAREFVHGKMSDGERASLGRSIDGLIAWHNARAGSASTPSALAAAPRPAAPARKASPVVKEKQVVTTAAGKYQSIAHAGSVHVVQETGYRGKPSGQYHMVDLSTGRRLGLGYMKRDEALKLLEAGHTGRTLARAKVGYAENLVTPSTHRANRALARYQRIQRGRAQAALTSGPMAPVAARPAAPSTKAAPAVAVNPDRVRHDFEEHRAARVDRLEERAARLHGESDAAMGRAHSIGQRFEFGQPILVGHHSERRARSDRAKMEAAMNKSVDLHRQAERVASRASAAAHNRAISSDDPAALAKLHEKLARHERLQAHMVETNRVIQSAARKGQNPHEALVALGHTPERARALVEPDFAGRRGFPDYATKNNGAEIRRTKERIAQLTEHRAAPVKAPEQHGRHTIEEGGNRVKVSFAAKPSEKTRAYMKSNGFRWAPSEGVWQKNASEQAWQHARAAAAMEG